METTGPHGLPKVAREDGRINMASSQRPSFLALARYIVCETFAFNSGYVARRRKSTSFYRVGLEASLKEQGRAAIRGHLRESH